MSHLIDGLDRAVLSHRCPPKTSIFYTEDQWDMSHYRVSPALLEGRDKSSPYRDVPVSHLPSLQPAEPSRVSPDYSRQCLCDRETVLDRKSTG